MTNEEIFAAWAPENSVWSRWAKPVLFNFVDRGPEDLLPLALPDLSWAPANDLDRVVVLDLPGEIGVFYALAFASLGFRPVPLYNAIPLPVEYSYIHLETGRARAAVDLLPIARALCAGAPLLNSFAVVDVAPPVFVLDANRRGQQIPLPEEFDNRSVSFTTDFPSATFLRTRLIQHALLVTPSTALPAPDLAHTLRKWQDAGMIIEQKSLDNAVPPARVQIAKPARFGSMFQRALAMLGMKRSPAGGFGAWLPDPEGHGGGG